MAAPPRQISYLNGRQLAVASGFMIPERDQVIPNFAAATQDTWTYKKNGVTVGVITITYTDATKTVVSDISRTS